MKYLKKLISILTLIICLLTSGCESYKNINDFAIATIYNDFISHLVDDNYQNCFPPELKYDDLLEAYLNKNISYENYSHRLDSLKKIRLSKIPKCILNLNDKLIFSNIPHEDIIKDMTESLKDPFVDGFFSDISLTNILDSIVVSSPITSEELVVTGVQLLPKKTENKYTWLHGMGQLGLSKCIVDKTGTKAIIYYEFVCGPKCGSGELAFLSRIKEKWEIEKLKNIWIY